MYRGKKKKLLVTDPKLKIAEVQNFLYIQLIPLVRSSIVFLEVENGTEIIVTNSTNSILHKVHHPFIKPSMIKGPGSLIPDSKKEHYQNLLSELYNVEFYDENKAKSLGDVEKYRYVDKTWDFSHTLIYEIIR